MRPTENRNVNKNYFTLKPVCIEYFINMVYKVSGPKLQYIFNIPKKLLNYILVSQTRDLRSILGDPNYYYKQLLRTPKLRVRHTSKSSIPLLHINR